MFVLQPFSAFFGNLVLLSSSIINSSEFFQSLFSWWFGNVMGQFLVTPLVLLVYINYKDINKIKFIVYGLYFAILNYVLICVLMIDNLALLLGIIVPLVMLLGRYEGLNYTLFAILMIALTSLYTTKLDYGIFSNGTPIDNLININFYILTHILISLINGILFIEKEILAKKLMLLNTNLSTIVEKEVQKNKQKDYFLIQQSRLAQMGEMISMIAHQWKQPLNNLSIINQALVLKYKRDKLDDAAIDKFKKDSNSQIQQMNNTINDFRDFFKPDKELKRVNVLDTVKTTLEIANPMLAHSNINIDIDIKNDIFVSIYPNEFNQVILNILNNARDALDENNIANKKIFINLQEKDNQVMLNIQDNAGGIPEEIIEEIFNPYFSTKDSKNGTGLGLYMSKLIIEEHMDGKLDASNINDGAKFTIVLNKE
jgi:signal transduction histidine kinase